jgi:hypothetical protein
MKNEMSNKGIGKAIAWLSATMALLAAGAGAQTTVTTSGGTTNQVPVFTGSATVGSSKITQSGSNVGIGTTSPRSALDVYPGTGVNEGIRLGSYWEFGTTAYMNNAYFGINAVLTNSSISASTNGFSPIWPSGQGIVMTENGGGGGMLQYYGINWNGSSAQQWFPSAFTPIMSINYNGQVGIGTMSPGAALEVDGNVKLTANSGASITFQDGTTQTTAYTGVSCGGDYAESVEASGERNRYEPGDVLVLTSEAAGDVEKSSEPYSTLVAGIYSTKPGYVGRRQTTPKSSDEIPMAMVGIVPTKVSAENGPIHRGDLLVTASQEGYAMKGTDRNRMLGAVIGKAMGSLNSGTGVIEVLVTLQ